MTVHQEEHTTDSLRIRITPAWAAVLISLSVALVGVVAWAWNSVDAPRMRRLGAVESQADTTEDRVEDNEDRIQWIVIAVEAICTETGANCPPSPVLKGDEK